MAASATLQEIRRHRRTMSRSRAASLHPENCSAYRCSTTSLAATGVTTASRRSVACSDADELSPGGLSAKPRSERPEWSGGPLTALEWTPARSPQVAAVRLGHHRQFRRRGEQQVGIGSHGMHRERAPSAISFNASLTQRTPMVSLSSGSGRHRHSSDRECSSSATKARSRVTDLANR